MLENSESLLPKSKRPESLHAPLRVLTLGIEDESMEELDRLLTTLGTVVSGRIVAPTRKIHPATYFGKGKLEDVKGGVIATDADAVVVDVELSPNQLRNIEKEVGRPVLDRPGVIIEIFSQHARTKESKTQVALARLEYLLPRLAHFWTHFERQRGKGMGEEWLAGTVFVV